MQTIPFLQQDSTNGQKMARQSATKDTLPGDSMLVDSTGRSIGAVENGSEKDERSVGQHGATLDVNPQ